VVASTSLLVTLALTTLAGPAAAAPPSSDDGGTPTAAASSAYSGPVSSANARFVVDGYRQLLDRDPDTSGLDFHLGRLASGGARTREAFTYGLAFSVEGSRREVHRAYDDLLDRAPDDSGRAYWTQHLQGHGVLDLRVLLLSSHEYRNRAGGTDEAWVDALYRDILGRAADASGRQYWLTQAGANVPRPLIAAGIYLSDEALGRRATTYYQEALSRTPSTGERAGAVALIRRIGERGLRARLLASDEAFETHLRAAVS
jgi:hypothetical protein